MNNIIEECLWKIGKYETVQLLDEIKELGFKYATFSDVSLSIDDMIVPQVKEKLIKEAAEEHDEDKKSRVVMNGKVNKFDRDDSHMPAYIRNRGDLDEPTFLRRQAD